MSVGPAPGTRDYPTRLCAMSCVPVKESDGTPLPREFYASCACGQQILVVRGQLSPHTLPEKPLTAKQRREIEARRVEARRAVPVPVLPAR